MQNILIINGSPRKNGNISKMLEAIKEEAEKQGANVPAIHVHDLQIKRTAIVGALVYSLMCYVFGL